MTVAELRDLLAGLPDDAPVLIRDDEFIRLAEVENADVTSVASVERNLAVAARGVRALLGMPLTENEWVERPGGREGLVLSS